MDEIALNPCLNFGTLTSEMVLAAGVSVEESKQVCERIFQTVQRDVVDAAHPESTASLSVDTSAGTLQCTVEAGVVTPVAFIVTPQS